MNTALKIFEVLMYGLGCFGIGAAIAVIYSVAKAFSQKQDRLLEQRFNEKHNQFLQRKQRVDQTLRKNRNA